MMPGVDVGQELNGMIESVFAYALSKVSGENLATGGQVTSTRNQPRLFEFGLKFSF